MGWQGQGIALTFVMTRSEYIDLGEGITSRVFICDDKGVMEIFVATRTLNNHNLKRSVSTAPTFNS